MTMPTQAQLIQYAQGLSYVLFGFSLATIYLTRVIYQSDEVYATYQKTTGVIEESSKVLVSTGTGNRAKSWDIVVKYTYSVNGIKFTGNRTSNSKASNSFKMTEEMEGWFKTWQPGATVPVYYNPAEPEKSLLVIKSKSWLTMAYVSIGLLLSAAVLFIYSKQLH